jgi:hypothetical protein
MVMDSSTPTCAISPKTTSSVWRFYPEAAVQCWWTDNEEHQMTLQNSVTVVATQALDYAEGSAHTGH